MRSLGVEDRKKVRGWPGREPVEASSQGPELYNIAVQLNGVTMTVETTYSQARERLKSLMDRAIDDREVIVVRRRSGGDVAMIAADELQSLMETAHLLRSAKNAERLLVALGRARSKSIKPTTLSELQRQVGLDA
jgi:antitoxin YefM